MTIEFIETIRDLAEICAELASRGIRFRAKKDETTKTWTVTLTGGF